MNVPITQSGGKRQIIVKKDTSLQDGYRKAVPDKDGGKHEAERDLLCSLHKDKRKR